MPPALAQPLVVEPYDTRLHKRVADLVQQLAQLRGQHGSKQLELTPGLVPLPHQLLSA